VLSSTPRSGSGAGDGLPYVPIQSGGVDDAIHYDVRNEIKGGPIGTGFGGRNPKVLTSGGIAWLRPIGIILLIPITSLAWAEPTSRVFAGYRVKLENAPQKTGYLPCGAPGRE
jgi:hypothetical protein